MQNFLESEIFRAISPESIRKLRQLPVTLLSYPAKELVRQQGSALSDFMIIKKGCLKVCEFMIDGKEIVSSYYFEGDGFPLYLHFGDVHVFPYNVFTVYRSDVYFLPLADLEAIIRSDPVFMENVLRFVARYTCFNKLILRSTQYNRVNQRLAYWLLNLDQVDAYKMPSTQEMLADLLHVNRSTLNQELKKLETLKVIEINGMDLRVLNPGYLEALIT